jgi:cytochrome c oxidase assembly protein subunit 15
VVFGAVVVFVGTAVTAAGPHAGGSGTGDDVRRLTIFGYDTFRHVIATHARVAGVFGGLAVVLWVLARRSGASRDLMLPLTAVCVAVGIAGLIGNLQYHQFDYPAGLVWAHVAVATMLWNALCWAFFAAGRPVRATRPAGDDPGIATPDGAQRTREPTTA